MYVEFLNLMTHMNTNQDAADEQKAQKDYVDTTNDQVARAFGHASVRARMGWLTLART